MWFNHANTYEKFKVEKGEKKCVLVCCRVKDKLIVDFSHTHTHTLTFFKFKLLIYKMLRV